MSRLHVLFQVFNLKSKIVKQFKELSFRRNTLETLEEQRDKLSQIDNFIFLGPSTIDSSSCLCMKLIDRTMKYYSMTLGYMLWTSR